MTSLNSELTDLRILFYEISELDDQIFFILQKMLKKYSELEKYDKSGKSKNIRKDVAKLIKQLSKTGNICQDNLKIINNMVEDKG